MATLDGRWVKYRLSTVINGCQEQCFQGLIHVKIRPLLPPWNAACLSLATLAIALSSGLKVWLLRFGVCMRAVSRLGFYHLQSYTLWAWLRQRIQKYVLGTRLLSATLSCIGVLSPAGIHLREGPSIKPLVYFHLYITPQKLQQRKLKAKNKATF